MRPAALAFALSFSLAGCDDVIFPAVSGGGTCDPTFAGVQSFLDANCNSCHGPPNGSGGWVFPDDLSADVSNGDGALVVPGDSANSLLWQTISHTGGTPMPLGAPNPLPTETISCVQEWIDSGAAL